MIRFEGGRWGGGEGWGEDKRGVCLLALRGRGPTLPPLIPQTASQPPWAQSCWLSKIDTKDIYRPHIKNNDCTHVQIHWEIGLILFCKNWPGAQLLFTVLLHTYCHIHYLLLFFLQIPFLRRPSGPPLLCLCHKLSVARRTRALHCRQEATKLTFSTQLTFYFFWLFLTLRHCQTTLTWFPPRIFLREYSITIREWSRIIVNIQISIICEI